MEQQDLIKQLRNLVPKNGVVYNEKIDFPEILCKPKLLPLKSMTLKYVIIHYYMLYKYLKNHHMYYY